MQPQLDLEDVECLQEQLGIPYLIYLHAWSLRGRYSVRHRPRLRSTFTGLFTCPFYGAEGGAVKEEPDWDRDEIIVCMVGAFAWEMRSLPELQTLRLRQSSR